MTRRRYALFRKYMEKFFDEIKKSSAYDASTDCIIFTKCPKRCPRSNNDDLAEFLIGKASAYNDTDFYKKAVALVGQKEVTLKKLEMGLPLWDDDKEYIKSNLN